MAISPLLLLYSGAADATPTEFDFTGSLQSFIAPTAGECQITAFGAQGGSSTGSGGAGAETQGTLALSAGGTPDFIVGGAGTNGGGNGSAGVVERSGLVGCFRWSSGAGLDLGDWR